MRSVVAPRASGIEMRIYLYINLTLTSRKVVIVKSITRKRFHCSLTSLLSKVHHRGGCGGSSGSSAAAAEAADGAGPVTDYTPLVNTLPRASALGLCEAKPKGGRERDEDGGCKPGESSLE